MEVFLLFLPSIILILELFNVLAGTDAILLGAETLRGLYPIETISTVGRICSEVGHLLFKYILFRHQYYTSIIHILVLVVHKCEATHF